MDEPRFLRLNQAIEASRFDGLVLNPGPTFFYLLGLPLMVMERPIVAFMVPGRPTAFVLPGFEAAQLEGRGDFALFAYGENPADWPDSFIAAARAAGAQSGVFGVESRCLRALELFYLQSAVPNVRFESADDLLDSLRILKDERELGLMSEAVRIAEAGVMATVPDMVPGVTELELGGILTRHLLRAGAEPRLPFGPIVAAGPNTADPHASPSDRPIQDGDLILIDWGAFHRGYCSDLTRVFGVGEVHPRLVEAADVVMRANEAGRAAAAPGVPAGEVDRATRRVIEQAGFGDYFTHRTGHGLGIEVHEAPYIRDDNGTLLRAGMTFTVEPGIYLEGLGGIRIEDDIVVTDDGARSLSSLPRHIIPVG